MCMLMLHFGLALKTICIKNQVSVTLLALMIFLPQRCIMYLIVMSMILPCKPAASIIMFLAVCAIYGNGNSKQFSCCLVTPVVSSNSNCFIGVQLMHYTLFSSLIFSLVGSRHMLFIGIPLCLIRSKNLHYLPTNISAPTLPRQRCHPKF